MTPPLPTPTPAQARAIEAPLGPVLVVAGPGSGKTFCLIHRVRHLIDRVGLHPRRVCAVTFTNKAAEEVASRLHRELGRAGDEIGRGTLHRLCLEILRAYPDAAGLRPGFGVADEEYQRQLVQRLRVRAERVRALLSLFGRHRLQGYPLPPGDDRLFERYLDALRSRNLVDFDDVIALAERLLREHPALAAEQAAWWDYVLVDECQDLNPVQYAIVRKLVPHGRVFAVGDDEQSIYSWAGADPRILERFRTDFDIEHPIVLDENRRCSIRILEAARRLVTRNPTLFEKVIEARHEGQFGVEAYVFPDEAAEANWLIADVIRDRAVSGLPWGEYAVVYRAHKLGQQLEAELLRHGIPCRLARGQALLDDEVIAYVVASLRVVRRPDDPVVLEGFAERVLPKPMLDRVRAAMGPGTELLPALRTFAQRNGRGDPDTRKAWRFIYHVENLAALRRAHATLDSLVEELLGQRVGRYRNPLEEHHDELSDPVEYPGAAALAAQLAAALEHGGAVSVVPARGVDVALVGMLRAAGVPMAQRYAGPRLARPYDVVLGPRDDRPTGWPMLVFKALQVLHARDIEDRFRNYVAFDLETTDRHVAECGIVEIAAVRVRDGVIVEQFHQLVRPPCPISPQATAVHGYRDEDVRGAPTFAEIWPAFRAFVGHDVLVAHNAQSFDVPVLRRFAEGLPGADALVFYDTLPLARALARESAKLEDLARRFGIAAGRSHHALDDASTLVGVLRHLGELRVRRARKACAVQALGWLGIGLALEEAPSPSPEERLLHELALPAALGRWSDCLETYAAEREALPADAPPVEWVLERLGGQRVLERLRAERTPAERYPAAMARLGALIAASRRPTLDASLDRLLELVALSTSEGIETDPHRLTLLTLHATKGLEFSRVYIVGVEDAQLPGFVALERNDEAAIQEGRRLLYVGMTRAKDRLVLSRAERRAGRPTGGDLFLREAGLAGVPAGDRAEHT